MRPTQVSAGLLMYRGSLSELQVLLAHPGGPFFAKKDLGAWTIPKGLVKPDEEPRAAAIREFSEEVGLPVAPPLIELGHIVQKGGKQVFAWAVEGDAPLNFRPRSNSFELIWPPRSGRKQSFPEVDRAEFFGIAEARHKLMPAQLPLVDRLLDHLSRSSL